MDYQLLSKQIFKPTWKWTLNDVQSWLTFISIPNLIPKFSQHRIDGSCIQALDSNDLEFQIGVKSKLTRRKILKWIAFGFNQFNEYLMSKNINPDMDIELQPPVFNRVSTSVLRQRIKPQNVYENDNSSSIHNQMIVTTYEGPHANFYTIGQLGTTIGKSNKNSIMVLQQSAAKFHAQIKHINGRFSIRDLGTNSGTFIKVFQKQSLKEGMIIEMGSFQFNIIKINYHKLQIILSYFNMINNHIQEFIINFNKKKIYSVGRKNTNDFNYDDQHLSGIHAKISLLNGQFIIQDMSSTNGTWIRIGPSGVISQFYQIYHGCVFKIGTTSTYICKLNTHPNQIPKTMTKCQICNFKDNDCVLVPCKHNVMCSGCASLVNRCPVCDTPIQNKFKIFI